MCTAISLIEENHYFGRNLDYEETFGEKICITPRNYTFNFSNGEKFSGNYAIMGVALEKDGYPLYFDAVNEKGLCMAALRFPEANYTKPAAGRDNIASYEIMQWILSKSSNLENAKKLLSNINITDSCFAENLPPAPLHWMLADKSGKVTIEQTKSGVRIYENPVGVLTNSPSFDMQIFNLNNYMHLSNNDPENTFGTELRAYSRGMGALGLPGDNSSMSRFVRACFVMLKSEYGERETDRVNQFFHILHSVYQQKGCVKVNGKDEITNYSVCYNADKGICYFNTYDNFTICSIDMKGENLDSDKLVSYELYNCSKIRAVN